MISASSSPRDLALAILTGADYSRGLEVKYPDGLVRENPGLTERDRAFIVNLVQGVFRWRIRLDWIIRQGLRFPFRKIEPPVLNILRLALYQIFFMDKVPDRAAVNEAVEQVKGTGYRHVAGFVNGILRSVCRHREEIPFPDPEKEPDLYLSVSHSYPLWLVKKWTGELGRDSAERLMAAMNRIPVMAIRVNTLRTDRGDILGRLRQEVAGAEPALYSPEGINLPGLKGPVTRLQGFKGGLFLVQGEAAQLGAHLLSPRPGERVLDLCAGMGGKSTHLAALMKDRGVVLALDRNLPRLRDLLENSNRLGAGSVIPVAADASADLTRLLKRPFNRVLVDAPCSGLGVISKNPDAKLTKSVGDIGRLAGLQKKILNQAVPLLGKGGTMLYMTCTVSREENEGVVEELLRENSQMTLEDLKHEAPEWSRALIDDDGFFRSFPHVHGMEGFFGALFRKK